MNKKQPFNTLLERYVYKVAAAIIEFASSENQTLLVNLANRVDTFSPPNNTSASHPTKSLVNSPLNQLEQQWQSALTKPLLLSETRQAVRQYVIALNQQQIETTVQFINTIEELIELASNTIQNSQSLARLLTHYRRIHTNYTARLVQLKTFQNVTWSSLEES